MQNTLTRVDACCAWSVRLPAGEPVWVMVRAVAASTPNAPESRCLQWLKAAVVQSDCCVQAWGGGPSQSPPLLQQNPQKTNCSPPPAPMSAEVFVETPLVRLN